MRDSSKSLSMSAIPTKIRSARIWHCKYRSLDALAELKKLETLVVASFPDASLDVLGELTALRYLSVLHLPKITDLSPLRTLEHLEVLSLQTLPSWDGKKRTVVDSLEPLVALPALRRLALIGVVPKDESLAPLTRCKHLVSARIHGFPAAETRTFFARQTCVDEHPPEPTFSSPSV
jgi:hypothetical protein